MKALRNHRIKFHCQLGLIGMLATVGLIAVCGEPDETCKNNSHMTIFRATQKVCKFRRSFKVTHFSNMKRRGKGSENKLVTQGN